MYSSSAFYLYSLFTLISDSSYIFTTLLLSLFSRNSLLNASFGSNYFFLKSSAFSSFFKASLMNSSCYFLNVSSCRNKSSVSGFSSASASLDPSVGHSLGTTSTPYYSPNFSAGVFSGLKNGSSSGSFFLSFFSYLSYLFKNGSLNSTYPLSSTSRSSAVKIAPSPSMTGWVTTVNQVPLTIWVRINNTVMLLSFIINK